MAELGGTMNRRFFLRASACATASLLTLGVHASLLTKQALARGAGATESAQAMRLFEQIGNLEGENPASAPSGVVKIAPGEVLTYQAKGYCLDSNLALPSTKEPLAFRPMKNYIAPELHKLYVALMRKLVSEAPRGVQVQQIIYTMRSEASDISGILKEKDYDFVNSLLPNGKTLLDTAHRPAEFVSDNGLSLWASQPKPPVTESYSLLAENVAAHCLGVGVLEVRATIYNASSKTFVFDTTAWVVESSRDVQAVALPVAPRYLVSASRPNQVAPPKVNPSQGKPGTQAKPSAHPEANGFAGH